MSIRPSSPLCALVWLVFETSGERICSAALALGFVAALASCTPEPRRAFPVGLVGPVTGKVEAEARRLGYVVADRPPTGAVVENAAASGGATLDWEALRFLGARAAAKGASGVFFRLAPASGGRDLLGYPEEWQALARVLLELQAVRPVLEGGADEPMPFAVPPGVDARAWSYRGRRYVLLVNASSGGAPLDQSALIPWRALFEVRSDARHVMRPCGAMVCLRPRAALWLEGRLL
jgi:hypothetical protein